MAGIPQELTAKFHTDPDELVGLRFARHFVIKDGEAGSQEGVDIQRPVHPACQALEVMQGATVSGFSEVAEGFKEVPATIRRHGESHRIGIDVKANNGQDGTSKLF
jgi:hypothetical protein